MQCSPMPAIWALCLFLHSILTTRQCLGAVILRPILHMGDTGTEDFKNSCKATYLGSGLPGVWIPKSISVAHHADVGLGVCFPHEVHSGGRHVFSESLLRLWWEGPLYADWWHGCTEALVFCPVIASRCVPL